MDNKLGKIEIKIDQILEKQGEMNATLVRQEAQLAYHIKRTDILESKFEPVEKHVGLVNAGLKILAALGALVGVAAGVIKIVEFLR